MPQLSFILTAVVLTSGEFAWKTGNVHIVAVLAALAAAWVALTSPRLRLRLVDGAVFAFLAVMSLTSLVHLTRFSLNTLSIGVIAAAMWFLARQSLTTTSRITFCLALLTSLIAAEAVVGLDQVYREFPSQRKSFEADPNAARRELGITNDAEWMLLTSRLRTAEPTGTYALTNTLGGTLACGIVLVCGFFVSLSRTQWQPQWKPETEPVLRRSDRFFRHRVVQTGHSAPLRFRLPLRLFLFAGAVLATLVFCLAATHSRSAVIACGAAASFGVLVFVKRRAVRIGLCAAGLCAVLAVIVVSDGARRSLLFRAEYWRATTAMIAGAPFTGCGAGNFQHRYTRYKLPQASEEIADPHNWLLEVAACGGIPAAVIFVGVLILFGRELATHWKPEWKPETERSGVTGSHEATPKKPVTPPEYRLRFRLPMDVPLRGSLAAFLGGVVAVAASYATELPISPVVLVPLVVLLPAAVWTCHELSRRRIVVGDSLLVAVVIAMLVHLSAAGGIMYSSTQVILWICGAIIVNRRCGAEEILQANRSFVAKDLLRAAPWCAAVVVVYLVNFLPVTESQRLLAVSREAKRPSDERMLLDAARRADSLSTSVALAELEFAERAWAASPNDESLRAIFAAAERLTKLAPESAKLHLRAGEALSGAANVARDENVRTELHTRAVKLVDEAAERYPTSASLQASRAMVWSRAGQVLRAAEVAEIALALDAATPHADQKLSPQVRAALEQL